MIVNLLEQSVGRLEHYCFLGTIAHAHNKGFTIAGVPCFANKFVQC